MERRFQASDAITLAYAGFLLALAVIFRDRLHEWKSIVAMTGGVIVGVPALIVLAQKKPNRVTRFISAWDLCAYLPLLFILTISMVWRVHRQDFDGALLMIDHGLGLDRVLEWTKTIENPWVTDFMKIMWIAYYALPLTPGIELWRRRDLRFWEARTIVLLGFYLVYLSYFVVPAMGGIDIQPVHRGAVVFEPLADAIGKAEGAEARDTYPSGHVVTSFMVIFICARNRLRMGWVAIPMALTIMFSTIYLRYHYMVDVLVGLAMGAMTAFLGVWASLDRRRVEVVRQPSWGRTVLLGIPVGIFGILVLLGILGLPRASIGELSDNWLLKGTVMALPLTLAIFLASLWPALEGSLLGFAVARFDPHNLSVGRRMLAWRDVESLSVEGVDHRHELRARLRSGDVVVLASRIGDAGPLPDVMKRGNAYRRSVV